MSKTTSETHLSGILHTYKHSNLPMSDVIAAIHVAYTESIPELAQLWHELELYKLLFGEIKDHYGKVDTLMAYKTYKQNEDFHQNFSRYMEAVKVKLELENPEDTQIGYCPIHKTQYISDNCVFCRKKENKTNEWIGPDSVYSYGPDLKPPEVQYLKPEGKLFGELIDVKDGEKK